jgi:hypothetical protein
MAHDIGRRCQTSRGGADELVIKSRVFQFQRELVIKLPVFQSQERQAVPMAEGAREPADDGSAIGRPPSGDRDVQIFKQQQVQPHRGLSLPSRIFMYHAAPANSMPVFVPCGDGASCKGVSVLPSLDSRIIAPRVGKPSD